MAWARVVRRDNLGDRRRWWAAAPLLAVLAALLLVSSSAVAGPPAAVQIAAAPRVPHGAKPAGAVPGPTTLTGAVVLKPRDNGSLQRFISAVTNKSSPSFGQYLRPGAFASRFGPTSATIAAVRSQLQADGLRVSGVSSDGLLVNFSGSAARAASAFHTGFERYRLADGTMGRATTSAVKVPASIAGSVVAVIGLDNLARERPADIVRAPASARGKFPAAKTAQFAHPAGSPTPCPDATSAATVNGGLTDDQIAHAYGAFGLYQAGDLGAGQRIGIYENEQFLRSDIKTFDSCYFGTTQAAAMMKRLTVFPVDGGQPTGPGSGEASLDVEDVSAMAPEASIDVYEGPFTGSNPDVYDSLDEYTAIVDADRDQVVSTSWGLCEETLQQGQPGMQAAENLLFEQAAAQGQSVFDAAGDSGSDDCDLSADPVTSQNPLSVDDPTSQPYVTAVGGTAIDDATQPPLEHVWNDGPSGGGGGGGISQSWEMPSWQQAATVPGIVRPGSADYTNAASVEKRFGFPTNFCQSTVPGATATTPCRLVPDVSAQADEYTGAVTVYSAEYASFAPTGWTTTGGTSSSAPIWAAMLALVNASPTCGARTATAHGVGFVSPLLYGVASDPADYAASFNDVTAGNNDAYGLDNGLVFPATTGYDLASGLGSPELTGPGGTAGLAYYLCTYATHGSRPIVTSLSPASGPTTGGESVRITGAGFESGGKPDVSGVQVGTFPLAASSFHVASATSITAKLPPARDTVPPNSPAPQDGAGPANVVVTLTSGQSSAVGSNAQFEYVDTNKAGAIPSVTGMSPSGGSETAPGNVTILGAGFTAATRVTFGGMKASSFTVTSPNQISVTPPPYSSKTACAPLPSSGVFKGENATNDVCQVQVRVSNVHGASAVGKILPPDEGPFSDNASGVVVPPPGCNCEGVAAPTEFDYVPPPLVKSVSTSAGPGSLASEQGGTVITVHGKGLNPLTLDWADFGDPSQEFSQDIDYVFLSGTEMQIVAPAEPVTVDPVEIPFGVKTLAGRSAPVNVTFAGVPTVSSVVNRSSSTQLDGVSGGPDTGQTPIAISGQGFAGQLTGPVQFVDSTGGPSYGTQYRYTVQSDTRISTQTVAQNPGLVDVEVCTVSGCSANPPGDEFWLYPLGAPKVDSASPSSGPASGGTKTVIGGENLGCPLQVFFGDAVAKSFTSVQTGLDCGSTEEVRATSPPGTAGSTVPVTVTTVESYFTGSGRSATSADFTYTK